MLQVVYAVRVCRNQAEVDEQVPMLLKSGSTFNELRLDPLEGPIDLKRHIRCPWCKGTGTIEETHEGFAVEHLECECEGRSFINRVTIAGGGKPLHPDWVRSIRDQCQAAGVEFVFESWGYWLDIHQCYGIAQGIDRNEYEVGEWHGNEWTPGCICGIGNGTVVKVGRAKSGRMLDGREWNPVVTPVP